MAPDSVEAPDTPPAWASHPAWGWLIWFGLALAILGFSLMYLWGGVIDLQRATDAALLITALENTERHPLAASRADMFLFVSGYLLYLGGIFVCCINRLSGRWWPSLISWLGLVLTICLALVDQVENIVLQTALGLLAPGSADLAAASEWIGALEIANFVKLTISYSVLACFLVAPPLGLFSRKTT